MNKSTITAHNTTSLHVDTRTNQSDFELGKSFSAKNISIKSDSLQMDVKIDDRWQVMRLKLQAPYPGNFQVKDAIIHVNKNGVQLQLEMPVQKIQINLPKELLGLLSLTQHNKYTAELNSLISIEGPPKNVLNIDKFGIKIAIDPTTLAMLKSEDTLSGFLKVHKNKIMLSIFNGHNLNLLNTPIGKDKLVNSIVNQLDTVLIKNLSSNKLAIKVLQNQLPYEINNNTRMFSDNQWHSIKLSKTLSGLQLTSPPIVDMSLKQSINRTPNIEFNNKELVQHLKTTQNQQSDLDKETLVTTLKESVSKTIKRLISRPFFTSEKNLARSVENSFITGNIAAIHTAEKVLLKSKNQHPPGLMQLFSQIKHTLYASLPYQRKILSLKDGQAPLMAQLVTKSAFENSLLQGILLEKRQEKPTSTLMSDTQSHSKLAKNIEALAQYRSSGSPDLSLLVKQAFSRLINEKNIHAPLIKQEIQNLMVNPLYSNTQLTPSEPSLNSFTHSIEKLIVLILSGSNLAHTYKDKPLEEKISSLMKALLPDAKVKNIPQLSQQLAVGNNSQLLSELSSINNSYLAASGQNLSSLKLDSETQLLMNLFLPTKLPIDCKQTQLQIGHYKSSEKPSLPTKTVWFIKLNFDYGQQGLLSAQAELMDNVMDCRLITNNHTLCNMAAPHIEKLKTKLQAHGLKVNEISLTENKQHSNDFYDKHAIINIQI